MIRNCNDLMPVTYKWPLTEQSNTSENHNGSSEVLLLYFQWNLQIILPCVLCELESANPAGENEKE